MQKAHKNERQQKTLRSSSKPTNKHNFQRESWSENTKKAKNNMPVVLLHFHLLFFSEGVKIRVSSTLRSKHLVKHFSFEDFDPIVDLLLRVLRRKCPEPPPKKAKKTFFRFCQILFFLLVHHYLHHGRLGLTCNLQHKIKILIKERDFEDKKREK